MKVLVTGGTSGLGFEIAKIMLAKGYEVGVVGQSADHSFETREKLSAYGNRLQVYTMDLSTKGSARELERKFIADFGGIDILVNNVGYATYETFEELDEDEVDRHVAVNLMAHLKVTKVFLPHMIKKGSGQVVNMSSVAGELVITPNALYMASKQAVNAWARALSYEVADQGIKVKVFCPGRVQTRFFDHPTFKRRLVRPEMKAAMPADKAAEKIVEKILYSSRFLFHIPLRYKFIGWAYRAIPLVERFLFRPLMIARTRDVKKHTVHILPLSESRNEESKMSRLRDRESDLL